ncbi:ATP-binding protein [Candidatus Methylacidiphilum infernorum]|uniref:ATP-binding protein n=1 Tax=Candidatus Methylacidiphilum infernorum TaxID=511746 RepID=A0ABX7PVE4_9BACT|nr:ATP-binding protein [Candidatus Methylacidiphilum infernorum]QSR86961.1 ATP-binding protein [Candidatus Methylacidiphilum infernorum]
MARNRFLNKEWQENHLKKIKNRAGPRYSTELNVDLPIAEIFDGISRTKTFYYSIREHYGKLNREFRRVPEKYENSEAQKLYNDLKSEISQLSQSLDKIKSYDTEPIPWNQIKKRAQKANQILIELLCKLREGENKTGKQISGEGQSNPRTISENVRSAIHFLDQIGKELRFFGEFSSSTKAKLSNSPFLFLTGVAGTGKTHLLCDVVENRFKNGLPAVLVFGELFATSDEPFKQIICQLGLNINKDINKGQFLRLLNNAGRQSGCRAILIIDALNETRQQSFWKRNLSRVVDEIKKYPHIALVVSVRTGFEDEVITKKLKKAFILEVLRGFDSVEIEWKAVNKFFKEFQIPLPEIPLLMPEFQNPLFLHLFCKAIKERLGKSKSKEQKQVFRGHEGATYIFESFVDAVSKKIANKFKIPNSPGKNIWDTIIEKIAEAMVEKNIDRIAEDEVVAIVKREHSSIDHNDLIKEMERNLLIFKVPRYSKEKNDYDGFDIRFPFQKFSDHLIGRFIFKKYEGEFGKANKNLHTAKKFFSEKRKLGKFFANSWNRGIVEALSIQCPEHLKGCELVEVAPYLKGLHEAQEAFVESLIWRKPNAFSTNRENTLEYMESHIIKTKTGRTNLLNAFLTVAPIPDHPFNADFLHNWLSKFTMPERDSFWSTFLHDEYGKRGAVDRLVEWGWSEQDKSHINDKSIRLCSVALCWFLSTPNRFLRDKTTKALVALLTNRLSVVLELIKQFKDVNDPYVAERLYAVAYGCAIRSKNDKQRLKDLAQWVYDEIFKNGSPPVHILLRDYARGIIEVARHQNITLQMDEERIIPPFKTQWPSSFPSESEFDYRNNDFREDFMAQKLIIQSIMNGDFGRYTVAQALDHFSFPKNVNQQKLRNWAIKRVFDLGYNVDLHGNFDRTLWYDYHRERFGQKPERIGKKYQWIALHELLARISDNFEFKEESWSDSVGKYEGPWQLSIRDIDPTCTLKEFPNTQPEHIPNFKWEIQSQYNTWHKNRSHSAWLKKSRDLPDPKKIIEFIDEEGIAWVALEGFIEWQEETPPELENITTRGLWYLIKSYLVREEDKDRVFDWAKRQHFWGRWMPESHEFYQVYLGEYPWAPAFLYHYIPYYCHHYGWTDGSEDKKIPAKILVTDDQYISSDSSIDCSTSKAISVKLPTKFLVDEMKLTQNYVDGRFFDNNGNLVAFYPPIFDEKAPSFVLIRKDKMVKFLQDKKYNLVWTLLGEIDILDGNEMDNSPGWLKINGAYTLNGRYEIVGKKKTSFKKSE